MILADSLFSRRSFENEYFDALTGQVEPLFDYSNPLICHGKGSGGGTNTVTSSASPPPQVLQAYQTALNAAQSAASQPLQQYSGPTIAGFTPDQTQAFSTIDSAQGSAQPYINQAQSLIQNGTQPLWSGVQQFSPSAIQNYTNPYTNQVVNSQVALEQNQDAQQQAALQGNAISSGAWGGDRAGVASAILSGQQDLANNSTNANLLNTGYNSGVSEFNTEQQAQLGANEANSYLNQQGAFGLANLGNEAMGTQLQGASAQLQSGALQQQLGQEALNVPYEQFQAQQAYPYQTAQYFANIAEGLGGESGGTSSTTSPAASTASQIAGLGLGGLSLLGGSGAFGSTGWLTGLLTAARGGRINPYRRGGKIPAYDNGGIATGVPDVSVSVIPTTTSAGGRGNGIPSAPKPEQQATPNTQNQISQLQGIIKAFGGGKSPSAPGGLGTGLNLGMSPGASATTDATNQADINNFLGPTQDAGFGSFTAPQKRGGRVSGFDTGGNVGGTSPTSAMYQSQQTPTTGSSYNNMTPEQLQSLIMRLPMGSAQQRQASALLQQKRMMPNVGQPAQGGFGSQTQGGATQAVPTSTAAQPMYGGYARGGFAGGGDTDDGIPLPATPDDLDRQADLRTELDNDSGTQSIPPVTASSLQAPGAFGQISPPGPSSAALNAGIPTAKHASPDTSDEGPTPTREKVDPWLALAEAGFATAAGRSPQALQNIGAGALAGIQNYQGQKKEADTVNEAADRLVQEAKQHRDQLAIEQQNADTTAEYRKDQAAYQNAALKQKELVKDAFGLPMGVFNPTTNSIEPIRGVPATPFGNSVTSDAQNSGSQNNNSNNNSSELQDKLSRYPAQMQPLILNVIQGRIPPDRTHLLNANPQAVLQAAADVDPTFDVATSTARMKTAADYSPAGKSGQQLTALENTSRHAAATALAALDLNNESSLWNPLRTQMNDWENQYESGRGDPRLGNYKSFLDNYGHEAMKVISAKANPGEAETAEFMKPMAPGNSPGQILGALSAKNEMALAIAQDKQEAYDSVMGPYGQKKQIVTPEAQQAFSDIDTLAQAAKDNKLNSPDALKARQRLQQWAQPVLGGSTNGNGAAQPSAPPMLPPKDQLKVGQVYSTPRGNASWDGSKFVLVGGTQ